MWLGWWLASSFSQENEYTGSKPFLLERLILHNNDHGIQTFTKMLHLHSNQLAWCGMKNTMQANYYVNDAFL